MHLYIGHKYILQLNKFCISTEMRWKFIWSQDWPKHVWLHLSIAEGKISIIHENNTCMIKYNIPKMKHIGHKKGFCKSSLQQGITPIFFVHAIRCIKVVASSPWYSIFQHRWIHFWSNILFECTNVGHSPKIKQNALSH